MADFVQELTIKLESARSRVRKGREIKALKAGAPTLFEIIDTEISLVVNKMTADKPLQYDEYVSAHGEVKGIRRIRDLINSSEAEEQVASQEVTAITDQLTQFKNDQKQQ